MSVPILVCECGLRLKAPGAKPGRVGRCPQCGGRLTVPEAPKPAPEPVEQPTSAGSFAPTRQKAASERPKRRKKTQKPMADGFLPVLDEPESWWLPSVLYPLRGAEGVGMVMILGTVFWVFLTLVPEYCQSAFDDAEKLGAASMGRLIALITALPAVILGLPVLFFWLQYLGRVLVSSAVGETIPPRTPDRNFDGFLNGLSPWFFWLLVGGSIGLLPLVLHGLPGSASGLTTFGLLMIGLPYALMALMIVFLHDNSSAALPMGVIGALLRLNVSFLFICVVVAGAIGLALGAFSLAMMLRDHHFWIYLLVCLACWMLAHWVAIVAMRILGTYYFRHRKVLKWHRDRPRWGVAWKLC